jgi:hypothetical protein
MVESRERGRVLVWCGVMGSFFGEGFGFWFWFWFRFRFSFLFFSFLFFSFLFVPETGLACDERALCA